MRPDADALGGTVRDENARDPLADQVAIITGGARGIGRAIALAYADAGAHIVMADIIPGETPSTGAEVERRGRRSLTLHADVRRDADLDRIVDETLRVFGRIDILVNNAGINTDGGFLGLSREDIRSVIDTDLVGPFILAQRAAREMIRLGLRGRILNISSIHSVVPSYCPHYSAAKIGLEQLTVDAALELAPYGIRVNCIRPGGIGGSPAPHIPLYGRNGYHTELANLALFLVTDQSSYITGSVVTIDGALSRLSSGSLGGRTRIAEMHASMGFPEPTGTPLTAIRFNSLGGERS